MKYLVTNSFHGISMESTHTTISGAKRKLAKRQKDCSNWGCACAPRWIILEETKKGRFVPLDS